MKLSSCFPLAAGPAAVMLALSSLVAAAADAETQTTTTTTTTTTTNPVIVSLLGTANKDVHGIRHRPISDGSSSLDAGGYDEFKGIQYAIVGERFSQSTPLDVVPEDELDLDFTISYRNDGTTPSKRSIINATNYGPSCWQAPAAAAAEPEEMAEECLYLNIWRPSIDLSNQDQKEKPLATLVYLHGDRRYHHHDDNGHTDGFGVSGSGRDFDGKVLASAPHNLIVVTLNYRLGLLGSLVTDELTGTGGMNSVVDVLNAMKWIQHNIANFGGSPTKVTLVGGSGNGSIMASILSVTPLAAGLFQNVVLQSGFSTTLGLGSMRPRFPNEGWQFTQSLLDKHQVTNVQELADPMRFPPKKLLMTNNNNNNNNQLNDDPSLFKTNLRQEQTRSSSSLQHSNPNTHNMQSSSYLTIDGYVIDQQPQDLYEQAAINGADGIIQPINMMLSTTTYDGLLVPYYYGNSSSSALSSTAATELQGTTNDYDSSMWWLDDININPDEFNTAVYQNLLIKQFGLHYGVSIYQQYDPALQPFGGHRYNHSVFAALAMLNSDLTLTCPARELAYMISQAFSTTAEERNVYLYQFAHHATNDPGTPEQLDVNTTGWMSHGVDQEFLQGFPSTSTSTSTSSSSSSSTTTTWTDLDQAVSNEFLSYLVRFVKTGNPNNDNDSTTTRAATTATTEWLPVTDSSKSSSSSSNRNDKAKSTTTAADVNTLIFASTTGGSMQRQQQGGDSGGRPNTYLMKSGTFQQKTRQCSLLYPLLYNNENEAEEEGNNNNNNDLLLNDMMVGANVATRSGSASAKAAQQLEEEKETNVMEVVDAVQSAISSSGGSHGTSVIKMTVGTTLAALTILVIGF